MEDEKKVPISEEMKKYLEEVFPKDLEHSNNPINPGAQIRALEEAYLKTHIGNDEILRRLRAKERPII